MTKEQFDSLSDDEAFMLCFNSLLSDLDDEVRSIQSDEEKTYQYNSSWHNLPYRLEFKNKNHKKEDCWLCCNSPYDRCLVPYSS